MRGAIPPLPAYVLMAWCLVKYRFNVTFTDGSPENRGETKVLELDNTAILCASSRGLLGYDTA